MAKKQQTTTNINKYKKPEETINLGLGLKARPPGPSFIFIFKSIARQGAK